MFLLLIRSDDFGWDGPFETLDDAFAFVEEDFGLDEEDKSPNVWEHNEQNGNWWLVEGNPYYIDEFQIIDLRNPKVHETRKHNSVTREYTPFSNVIDMFTREPVHPSVGGNED